ncbi:MAG: hypothetical protein M3R27_11405 [Bacteroidota bacterium]|nr:hypothetical protein [Bacteroidota bacterium]
MKDFDFDKLWIGLLAGIAVPALALLLYFKICYSYMSFAGFINYMKMGDTYTPVLSLCVLTNLAVFYPFIWKEKWSGAKGVLGATFIWAAIILFIKFFT